MSIISRVTDILSLLITSIWRHHFFFVMKKYTGVFNHRYGENENLFFVGEIAAIFKIVIVYEEEMSAIFSIFWKNCNTIKRGIWNKKQTIWSRCNIVSNQINFILCQNDKEFNWSGNSMNITILFIRTLVL